MDSLKESSCSGSRVLPYLMTLGTSLMSSAVFVIGLYGEMSASGENMRALRV